VQGVNKILVVDDDDTIRTIFKINLEAKGYLVDTAETGEDAILKMNETFYNLMLIDIRLPDMEGTELLSHVTVQEPKTRKIIVTGFPSVNNAMRAVNGGADGYILKPVDMDELIAKIEELLRKQRGGESDLEIKLHEYIEQKVQSLRSVSNADGNT